MGSWIVGIALSILSLSACSAKENTKDVDVMDQYHCVDIKFSRLNPSTKPLNPEQELTLDGVKLVAAQVSEPMRQALIAAADATYKDMNVRSAIGIIVPKDYYLLFVSHLGTELPHFFPVEECNLNNQRPELFAGYIYDVAINRYFYDLIGRGRIYEWFANHGGVYAVSPFMAAMVSLELSGRESDPDAWKRYYTAYVKKKFANPSMSK